LECLGKKKVQQKKEKKDERISVRNTPSYFPILSHAKGCVRCTPKNVHLSIYIYIYIYIEREREKESEKGREW